MNSRNGTTLVLLAPGLAYMRREVAMAAVSSFAPLLQTICTAVTVYDHWFMSAVSISYLAELQGKRSSENRKVELFRLGVCQGWRANKTN